MSEIVQLFKDKNKTIKIYPKTLASEVYITSDNSILNELSNKINFEVESENNIEIPSIGEKLDLIINNKIPELSEYLDSKLNIIDEFNYIKFLNSILKNVMYTNCVIIGDSISEGARVENYNDNGYANLLIKSINNKYGRNDRGFVNFRDIKVNGATNYHSLTFNGYSDGYPHFFDDNYFGGVNIYSTNLNDEIIVEYTGKDCRLAYTKLSNGGKLQITIDELTEKTIDTSIDYGWTYDKLNLSEPLISSTSDDNLEERTHKIKIKKIDVNPTSLQGMIYGENLRKNNPLAYNVGRSSIALSDISNDVLDIYTSFNNVILALGVNDNLLKKDITVFKSKVDYICNSIKNKKGNLLIVDFIFNENEENIYKTVLREKAKEYGIIYIDFYKLTKGNIVDNINSSFLHEDEVHPTENGHNFIHHVLTNVLGIPNYYEKKENIEPKWKTINTFKNNWSNTLGGENVGGLEYKVKDFNLYLRGLCSGDVKTASTVIFTLPENLKPSKNQFIICNSDVGVTKIIIKNNGDVELQNIDSGATYISFCGIYIALD